MCVEMGMSECMCVCKWGRGCPKFDVFDVRIITDICEKLNYPNRTKDDEILLLLDSYIRRRMEWRNGRVR